MNELTTNPFNGGRVAESAGARALQSREVAELQTKFLMAERFPRDEKRAYDGVVNAFSRPGLAEHAQYEYAKGGSKISGLSIHALQAIAQQWGNIEFGWAEVSRGDGSDGVPYSEVRAMAVDLQSRTMRPLQFIVRHWRDTKSGGYKLKDEREIYELCANMAQRRVRSCLEAVIPKDVQDAAEQQADLTLRTKADTSPEAMVKMVEAFAKLGVTKDQIEKRIQSRLDAISPAQVVGLKRIYASLRDEMSEPGEWFEMGTAGVEGEGAAAAGTGQKTSAADALAQRRASRQKAAKEVVDTVTSKEAVPEKTSLQAYLEALEKAPDADAAALIVDEARGTLNDDELHQLGEAYSGKWQAPE